MLRILFSLLLFQIAASEFATIEVYQCLIIPIPSGENLVSVELTVKDGSSFSVYYFETDPVICNTTGYFKTVSGMQKYRETINYPEVFMSIENDNLLFPITVDWSIEHDPSAAASAIATILIVVFIVLGCCCVCSCLFRNRKKIATSISTTNHVILEER